MTSIFEQAQAWARRHFKQLDGGSYDYGSLGQQLDTLLESWPGISTKRWLFVYSPNSASEFFEVENSLLRLMMAKAKLGTVAESGGMLLGADFSKHWGTAKCVGTFRPLLVCKPATPILLDDDWDDDLN